MSAYVCEDKTINRIVAGLYFAKEHGDYGRPTPKPAQDLCDAIESPREFGRTLHSMNVNAVEQRYPDCVGNPDRLPGPCDGDGHFVGYGYQSMMPPQPIQLYKSLQGYLYQCSEGDVDELPLYKMLQAYVTKLACHMIENTPAYDKAEWA